MAESAVRAMKRNEVEWLLDWAAAEGWNPGKNDATLYWNLDPEGFLAIDVNDEMAGGGAIIRHNASFGFMGLFLMQPHFRGQHLGTKLWYARRDRLIERLQPGGTIGLDAVDRMIPFYAQGGFQPFYRHRRFEWQAVSLPDSTDANVVELDAADWEEISSLDQCCFPGNREAFLQSWCRQPGAVSLAAKEQGVVQGFGVIRPCIVGWKIGPLFADDSKIAARLLRAFRVHAGDAPIYLDVPDNNPQAIFLCQQYAMKEVFGCVRMYFGPTPDMDHERVYAVTTLEVG